MKRSDAIIAHLKRLHYPNHFTENIDEWIELCDYVLWRLDVGGDLRERVTLPGGKTAEVRNVISVLALDALHKCLTQLEADKITK